MSFIFNSLSPAVTAGLFVVAGIGVGTVLGLWSDRLLRQALGGRKLGPARLSAAAIGTGLLFGAYVYARLAWHCQEVASVRPFEYWWHGRIVYHLALIAMLVVATITDLRDYVIPDAITGTGVLIGLSGAVISGDLQIVHVWMDANYEVHAVQGALIPEWVKAHHHWHGLAWSAAGLAAGAGVTWLVRAVSSRLIGQETLGLGDVTLMGMIGSFLGWQPVLVVLTLAPLCGLLLAVGVKLLARVRFVPFGPFLSLATVVVLLSWRWIWDLPLYERAGRTLAVRHVFGDWRGLLILAALAFGLFVLLLISLRLYRAIPVQRRAAE